MSELEERLKSLQDQSSSIETIEQLFLPVTPDSKRSTPSAFLRSALFSTVKSRDRVYMKDQVLASHSNITITFTGETLNQEDLTLWNTLVHLAKHHPIDSHCSFSAYEILKSMGYSNSGNDHKILYKNIKRLAAAFITIKINNIEYFGHLINGGMLDDLTGKYKINLDKTLFKIYTSDQCSWINFDERSKLRGKPLAQFLHGYYTTHKAPYHLKVDTLLKLSGSKAKQKSSFKRQLDKALTVLTDIEFLQDFEINGDIVNVTKK